MAECPQLSFPVASVSGKKVVADFSGEQVASDFRALELREVADRIGLVDFLVRAIHDSRHPSYITHSLRDLILQRIFQIACGYEDVNDANTLRMGPAYKAACDRLPSEEDLTSQPTFSRLENAITAKTCAAWETLWLTCLSPPARLLLDFDETDDPAHGDRQRSLFNGYYDEFCFQPMLIFEGKSGNLRR